jgi:hypothetical protein
MISPAVFDLGAWLLKCNPKMWDLAGFVSDGHRTIRRWTISRYRERLAAGQPVLLWVTGSTGADPIPGLWGAGVVTGRYQTDGHTDGDHDEHWLTSPCELGSLHWLPVNVTLFSAPVPRTVLAEDPRLRDLEVFTNPRAGNPQRVTTDQLTVIGRYLDHHATAAYGPTAQARAIVTDAYRNKGWEVETATTAGWDLTCRHGAQVLRIVTRPAGDIAIGRAEVAAAADPDWRLIVVDGPDLTELDGAQALDHAEPTTYRIPPP